ncbi:hypothetical protein ACG1BZ_11415 [Microbulbifer sp. CNSA002]|uniref:hypothetical protein n=1 Tax=unclassified Microbulbifer TaxID=2619833 RepID=UPI0039B59C6F
MFDVNSLDLRFPIIEQIDDIYCCPFSSSEKYQYDLGGWHLSFYGESRAQPGENSRYTSRYTPIHSEESYSKFNDTEPQWDDESPYIWFRLHPIAAIASLGPEWNEAWTIGTIALDIRVIQIRKPAKPGTIDISDHSQLKSYIFKQHSDKQDLLLSMGHLGCFSAGNMDEIQEHEINGRNWYEIIDGNRNLNCCFNLYTPLSDKHLLHVAYIVNQFWPPYHMPSKKALQVSKLPLWSFMQCLELSSADESLQVEASTLQNDTARIEEEWPRGVDSADLLDLDLPIILQVDDIHWLPFDRAPVHHYDLGDWHLSFSGKRNLQAQAGNGGAPYTTPIQDDESYPRFNGDEARWEDESSYVWFNFHQIMAQCSVKFGEDCALTIGTVFFDVRVIQLCDPAMLRIHYLPDGDQFKQFILGMLIPHSKGDNTQGFKINERTWYKVGYDDYGKIDLYTCLSTKHFLHVAYNDDQFGLDGWYHSHTRKSGKLAKSPLWSFMENLKLSKIEEGSQVLTGTVEQKAGHAEENALEEISSYTEMKERIGTIKKERDLPFVDESSW